ncbi:MAG: phosphatidylserine decarboxylase [Candidatus Cloacimonadota bacterium]|nr:MAG: phosphatidylserine decarboxylase [Candidatus Cloacimonadota bacterium]
MTKVQFIDRESSKLSQEIVYGEEALRFCYESFLGQLLLENFIKYPWVSKLYGLYQDTEMSSHKIPSFIKKLGIDENSSEKETYEYKTFNEYFSRTLKKSVRPIDNDEDIICLPGDGRLSIFPKLSNKRVFSIKGHSFTLKDFLQSEKLATKYDEGSLVILRLCPADYHRFHFPCDGKISKSHRIQGVLYSVNPVAIEKIPDLFAQNERQFSTLKTSKFGDILMGEVGATMVGKIVQNYKADTLVKKGDEKGYFVFGASTVVLLFEKNKVKFSHDLLEYNKMGYETLCKMGTALGKSL